MSVFMMQFFAVINYELFDESSMAKNRNEDISHIENVKEMDPATTLPVSRTQEHNGLQFWFQELLGLKTCVAG